MKKRCDDWITSYLKFVDNSEPPTLFKEWVAVSALASVLQRKCFTTWETSTYPNFYIAIVGPSGCRKGTAITPVKKMLREVGIRMSADSITREALIAEMADCLTVVTDPKTGDFVSHSSITVISPELVVFVNRDNAQLIKDLCDLFDCGDVWTYRTKNKGTNSIEGVWLNLLGATTPELIQIAFPQEVIGGGFTSRMIFVYGDKKSKIVPFPIITPEEEKLRCDLMVDLELMWSLCGEYKMTPEFLDLYGDWYVAHCSEPAIKDHQFGPYLERRPTHLRKLAMVMSASRRGDMIITAEDFKRSVALLERTEEVMPNVYRAYGRTVFADLYPRLIATIAKKKKVRYSMLLSEFYKDVTRDEFQDMLRTLASMEVIALERMEEGSDLMITYKGSQGKFLGA